MLPFPGMNIETHYSGCSSALSHNFDLKPLFIGSILLFETGSAICGAAPNMDALIVGGAGIFLG